MRRRRFLPLIDTCESRIALSEGDGLGPPPEVEAGPPGGVLEAPDPGELPGAPPPLGPLPMDPADPYA